MRGPEEPIDALFRRRRADDSVLDAPDAMGLRLHEVDGSSSPREYLETPPPVRRSPVGTGSTPPAPPRVASVVPRELVLPEGSEPPVRGPHRADDDGDDVLVEGAEEWWTLSPPAEREAVPPERRGFFLGPVVVFGFLLGVAAIPPVVAVLVGVQEVVVRKDAPTPAVVHRTPSVEAAILEPAEALPSTADEVVARPSSPDAIPEAAGAEPTAGPHPAVESAPTKIFAPWGTDAIGSEPGDVWDAP